MIFLRSSRTEVASALSRASARDGNLCETGYKPDLLMKKAPCGAFSLETLAEWTGLEPATPGVTGRYSNQLNYHS